jgi:hypothetical protein
MWRSEVAEKLHEIRELAVKCSAVVPCEITSKTSAESWEVEALNPLLRRIRVISGELLGIPRDDKIV